MASTTCNTRCKRQQSWAAVGSLARGVVPHADGWQRQRWLLLLQLQTVGRKPTASRSMKKECLGVEL